MTAEKVLTDLEKKEIALRKLAGAVDAVLSMESGAGRDLFAHLYHFCAFAKPGVGINRMTGEPSPTISMYNDALRSVYLHLRKLASPDLIRAAEELAEKKPEAAPTKSNTEEKSK